MDLSGHANHLVAKTLETDDVASDHRNKGLVAINGHLSPLSDLLQSLLKTVSLLRNDEINLRFSGFRQDHWYPSRIQRREDFTEHTGDSVKFGRHDLYEENLIPHSDGLRAVRRLVTTSHQSAFASLICGVQNQDRNILFPGRLYCQGVKDPRSHRGHLSSLLVGDHIDLASVFHDPRVSRTDTVHIGPDLDSLRTKGHSEDSRRVVRALESENGSRAFIRGGDKALSEHKVGPFIFQADDSLDVSLSDIHVGTGAEVVVVCGDHPASVNPMAGDVVSVESVGDNSR